MIKSYESKPQGRVACRHPVKAGRTPNRKMALFLLEMNLTGLTRLDS